MRIFLFVIILISLLMAVSCSSVKKNKNKATTDKEDSLVLDLKSGPPTIVYKTKNDYRENVPVSLTKDKSKIASFPHPRDIQYKGELAYPVELNGGYLLDVRGIDTSVSFLSITYEDYFALKKAPSPDSLFLLIIDDDPLLEFYNCGSRYAFKEIEGDLNRLIDEGRLGECACLKEGRDQ